MYVYYKDKNDTIRYVELKLFSSHRFEKPVFIFHVVKNVEDLKLEEALRKEALDQKEKEASNRNEKDRNEKEEKDRNEKEGSEDNCCCKCNYREYDDFGLLGTNPYEQAYLSYDLSYELEMQEHMFTIKTIHYSKIE